MLKKFIFSFFLVFSCSVSYGQWKSFYPENNQSKSNTQEKKEKENLNYNNLFFNALKQKSLENYEHSITLFEKCIEKKPSFTEAYYQLSLLNKNLNRVFDAIEYSNVAIENEPKNIWYLRNHAEILFLNQQPS